MKLNSLKTIILSLSITGLHAQELLISEDFSSAAWENEFLRLNPGTNGSGEPLNPNSTNPASYSTPAVGGGNAYTDLNNKDLYFNKYKLSGAVETLNVLPCPEGEDYAHINIAPVEIRYADPSIYVENGKYYLSGTRSGSPAGFILLESDNLTEWQISSAETSGMILQQGGGAYGESGFWAPQILKDNSRYYLTYTADEHVAIASSATLNGKYTQESATAIDPTTKNIDSYLFKDDNGKYYLYHVRFNNGNYIWVAEFDMATGKINKQTLRQCLSNTQAWENTPAYTSAPIMEGPTVIKRDGIYYLFYSANHYLSIDYAVGYATSTSPLGPWTKYAGNPIIHRSIVNENGSGHGDVFTDKGGNPYYVYHVHQSETTVAPRKTRIVPLEFTFNSATNRYDIRAKAESIIIPKVRATNNEAWSSIEKPFTGAKKTVAFRLNNNATGMIEFPEIPASGEITLHIRNGNQTTPTDVALEWLDEEGVWKQIHVFNLQNWGAYPDYRDEVLRYIYNIPSEKPVKLRLINNVSANRYINLFRFDILSDIPDGISPPHAHTPLSIQGRKIIFDEPASLCLYNTTGMLLYQKSGEKENTVPENIGSGIFVLKTGSDVYKICLQ